MVYVLWSIARYWTADYYYNYGKNYNSAGKPDIAIAYLTKAIDLQPNQALYHNEIAISYAISGNANSANQEIKKAVSMEPNNINILRSQFGIYIRLAEKDQNYLIEAKNTLDKTILMAPNDPKLFYNLGLLYARVGKNDEAKKILGKAIELKPDYDGPKQALKIIEEEK